MYSVIAAHAQNRTLIGWNTEWPRTFRMAFESECLTLDVTKLGRAKDMKEEFDKSKVIQERSPDAGVYPVDDLVCAPQESALGPNVNQIFRSCRDVLPQDLNNACAIQQPKYYKDLQGYAKEVQKMARQEIAEIADKVYKSLLTKLQDLHMSNVYHLDIKAENIAMVQPPQENIFDVRLADFGLAVLADDPQNVKKLVSNLQDSEFQVYYRTLMTDGLVEINFLRPFDLDFIINLWTKSLYVLKRSTLLRQDVFDNLCTVLFKTIDRSSLIKTVWSELQSYGDREMRKQQYIQLQTDYTTNWKILELLISEIFSRVRF